MSSNENVVSCILHAVDTEELDQQETLRQNKKRLRKNLRQYLQNTDHYTKKGVTQYKKYNRHWILFFLYVLEVLVTFTVLHLVYVVFFSNERLRIDDPDHIFSAYKWILPVACILPLIHVMTWEPYVYDSIFKSYVNYYYDNCSDESFELTPFQKLELQRVSIVPIPEYIFLIFFLILLNIFIWMYIVNFNARYRKKKKKDINDNKS